MLFSILHFASTFTDEPDVTSSLTLPETQTNYTLFDTNISSLILGEM